MIGHGWFMVVANAQGEASAAILAAARKQHGVVSRRELLAMGFSSGFIHARLRKGFFLTVHPGVYAVGHDLLAPRGFWQAALLAVEGSALARQTAAALWGLTVPGTIIHLIKESGRTAMVGPGTCGSGPRSRQVRLHRTRSLPADTIAVRDGLAVTSVERTIADMAGERDRTGVEDLLAEADRLHILDFEAMRREAERGRGRKGVERLRLCLAGWHPPTELEKSVFEKEFAEGIVARGAPPPQRNRQVNGHEVDCFWPQFGLMIELDGCSFHRDPATQVNDRKRDVEFALMGIQVNRFAYPEFRDDPEDVCSRAIALLRARGWNGKDGRR